VTASVTLPYFVSTCKPGTLSDDVLALFVTFMARDGMLAPSSCTTYVQGVATTFRESGFQVPSMRDLYKTSRVLKGVALTHYNRCRPARKPLDVPHLLALYSYSEGDDLDGCAVHLLAVWSMIGLFRGSELVSGPSDRAITPERALVSLREGGQLASIAELRMPEIAAAAEIIVQLDASKTRQRGTEKHPDFRMLHSTSDHRLCPIQALSRYLRRRVLCPPSWAREAPLFITKHQASPKNLVEWSDRV